MAQKTAPAETAEPYSPWPWQLDGGQLRDRDGNAIGSFPYDLGGPEDLANAQLVRAAPEVIAAARALLRRLDGMSTWEFYGAERSEREALREALADALAVDPAEVYPLPSKAEARQLMGDERAWPVRKALEAAGQEKDPVREVMTWTLAEIAHMCGFCFNPNARDVRAAQLAREALAMLGISDPAAWLAAQRAGEGQGKA